MTIDTRKVTGRRQLRFETCADILADAERLVAAPSVRALGNWTLGQTLHHLESAMRMSLDGVDVHAPWYVRLLARLFKKRVLAKPMSPGFKLPAEAARYLVTDQDVTPQESLAAMRVAIERLGQHSQRAPHPVFGALTVEEWNQLHCRHAEMHLSFFVP